MKDNGLLAAESAKKMSNFQQKIKFLKNVYDVARKFWL